MRCLAAAYSSGWRPFPNFGDATWWIPRSLNGVADRWAARAREEGLNGAWRREVPAGSPVRLWSDGSWKSGVFGVTAVLEYWDGGCWKSWGLLCSSGVAKENILQWEALGLLLGLAAGPWSTSLKSEPTHLQSDATIK